MLYKIAKNFYKNVDSLHLEVHLIVNGKESEQNLLEDKYIHTYISVFRGAQIANFHYYIY